MCRAIMSQNRRILNSIFSYVQAGDICHYSTKANQKGIVSSSSMED